MAKHKIDGKGKVSKGLRRSSLSLHRAHPKQAPQYNPACVPNIMRQAFDDCKVMRKHPGDRLIDHAIHRNQGFDQAHKGKGWNAHLSHATYTKLHAEGVM